MKEELEHSPHHFEVKQIPQSFDIFRPHTSRCLPIGTSKIEVSFLSPKKATNLATVYGKLMIMETHKDHKSINWSGVAPL
jgi:hypothetical protein